MAARRPLTHARIRNPRSSAPGHKTVMNFLYTGELELFEAAVNWKKYWTSQIAPYIGRTVLEAGAGIGSNTLRLVKPWCTDWLCLEPDPGLAAVISKAVLPPCVRVVCGMIADLKSNEQFDTIIYADVLEHIANDTEEIAEATRRLKPGGALIILAPAHQILFSRFDVKVGHYRRYNRNTLEQCAGPDLALVKIRYLDSLGLLASCANRWLLSPEEPSIRQVKIWDRLMVPASRMLDPILGWRAGKSILAIWRRQVEG